MRANLEDVRAYRLRTFASKKASITFTLTGTLVIPLDGPEVYFLDAGASTKAVRLPALTEEFAVLIANIGSTSSIEVYNSLNVLQTTIAPGEINYFFSGPRWVWLSNNFISTDPTGMSDELRVVTNAGVQTITSIEPGLAINKAVASVTPVNLPAIASRNGKPVRLVDWGGNVDITNPLTVTPNGAEKINNAASWEFSNLSSGGAILFPSVTLGGWTLGA